MALSAEAFDRIASKAEERAELAEIPTARPNP